MTLPSADSAAAAPRAAIGNPVEGNQGFGTIVEHDALLGSTETEGTVALGGDLSFGPGYNVAIHTAGAAHHAAHGLADVLPSVGQAHGPAHRWLRPLTRRRFPPGGRRGPVVPRAPPAPIRCPGSGSGPAARRLRNPLREFRVFRMTCGALPGPGRRHG